MIRVQNGITGMDLVEILCKSLWQDLSKILCKSLRLNLMEIQNEIIRVDITEIQMLVVLQMIILKACDCVSWAQIVVGIRAVDYVS